MHPSEEDAAKRVIEDLECVTADARDNLRQAKVNQAAAANETQKQEDCFEIGDQVLLSTFHRWRDYAQKGDK